MRSLTVHDLAFLSIGCAILGSGGGGDPAYSIAMAKHHLQQYGPIKVLSMDELGPDDFVMPIAFMGAPLVGMEKLPSGREFDLILDMVEKTFGRRPTVLMAAEIGGSNGFAPFCVAGKLGLPVLDGDLMGRAFPQLEMTSCSVTDVSISPAFFADSQGNTVMIESNSVSEMESIGRYVAISMGSSCAIAFALMDKEQAKRAVIPNALTWAMEIGQAMLQTKDPLEALLQHTEGVCLGEGTVTSVNQSIKNGFLEGSVAIVGENASFELLYQNEYLLAKKDGHVIATTPDILMLVEKESGTPISTESLRYGLKVALIALPAPAIWKTEKGLSLVGPKCFGYATTYQPIERTS